MLTLHSCSISYLSMKSSTWSFFQSPSCGCPNWILTHVSSSHIHTLRGNTTWKWTLIYGYFSLSGLRAWTSYLGLEIEQLAYHITGNMLSETCLEVKNAIGHLHNDIIELVWGYLLNLQIPGIRMQIRLNQFNINGKFCVHDQYRTDYTGYGSPKFTYAPPP